MSIYDNLKLGGQVFGDVVQGYKMGRQMKLDRRADAEYEKAQTQQAEYQSLMQGFYDNPTMENIQKMMLINPKMADGYQKALGVMNEQERKQRTSEANRIYSLMQGGFNEDAQKEAQAIAESYRNSGKEEEAKRLEQMAAKIEQDPKGAMMVVGGFLHEALGPDKFTEGRKDTFTMKQQTEQAGYERDIKKQEALDAPVESEEARDKHKMDMQKAGLDYASDVAGLTKLNMEIRQMADDTGKIPKDKIPEAEDKLRGEYDKKTAQFDEVKSSFEQLKEFASQGEGKGDLGIIFSYMKILDPGVAVMEGDVRNVSNTSSMMDRAVAAYKRVFDGKKFSSDEERQGFVDAAKGAFDAQKRRADKLVEDYETIAKRRGLNSKNIILRKPEESTTELKKRIEKEPENPQPMQTGQQNLFNPQGVTQQAAPQGAISPQGLDLGDGFRIMP